MLVLRVLRFYTLTPAFASQAMNVYNPEHLQNANLRTCRTLSTRRTGI